MQHCLAFGAIQHRINHLLRNIPGGDLGIFGMHRTEYDEAILGVVRSLASCATLPTLSRQIAALPLRHGGLGYRTWSNSADCAFLASYVRTSFVFPDMFPTLAGHYPCVLSLTDAQSAQSFSTRALQAFMALKRLAGAAPSVYEILRDDGAKPLRHLQHAIASASDDAAHLRVIESIIKIDDVRHPRHLALHNSQCGDASTWGLVPNDPATTFTNKVTEVAIRRRLLLPIITPLESERRQCPTCLCSSEEVIACGGACQIDVYGDHAIRCKKGSKQRTKFWHDPLVRQFYSLAKMVSLPCGIEVQDMITGSDARPDCVVFRSPDHDKDTLTDVRTADVTGLEECVAAANRPGAAADMSANIKNRKWLPLTEAQGYLFVPLVVESGGRVGDSALEFINRLSYSAGGSLSDRLAFVTFALQRIRALTVKGTAEIILSRPFSRDAPGGVPLRGEFPLASSMPRGASRPSSTNSTPQANRPAWINQASLVFSNHLHVTPPWGATIALTEASENDHTNLPLLRVAGP